MSKQPEWILEAQGVLRQVMAESYEEEDEENEVYAILPDAYSDAMWLLRYLQHYVPMPDIIWLLDGGIGFEWRNGQQYIATMSVYGDGDGEVVYGGKFGEERVKGTCTLTEMTTSEHSFVDALRKENKEESCKAEN